MKCFRYTVAFNVIFLILAFQASAGDITGTVTLTDSPGDASGVLVRLFEIPPPPQIPTIGLLGFIICALVVSLILLKSRKIRVALSFGFISFLIFAISLAFAAVEAGSQVTDTSGTFTFPNGKIDTEYIIECAKACYISVSVTFTTDSGGSINLGQITMESQESDDLTPTPTAEPLPTMSASCTHPDSSDCGGSSTELTRAPTVCEGYPKIGGRAILLPGCGIQLLINDCNNYAIEYGLGLSLTNTAYYPTPCGIEIYPSAITTGVNGSPLVLDSDAVQEIVGSFDPSPCGSSPYIYIRNCGPCERVNAGRSGYLSAAIIPKTSYTIAIDTPTPTIVPGQTEVDITATLPDGMPYHSLRLMAEHTTSYKKYEVVAYYNNIPPVTSSPFNLITDWSGYSTYGEPLDRGEYRLHLEIIYHPDFGTEPYIAPANVGNRPTFTIEAPLVDLYCDQFSGSKSTCNALGLPCCPMVCDELDYADTFYVRVSEFGTPIPTPIATIVCRNANNQPVTTPFMIPATDFDLKPGSQDEVSAGPYKFYFGIPTPASPPIPGLTPIPVPLSLLDQGGASVFVEVGSDNRGDLGQRQRFLQKCPKIKVMNGSEQVKEFNPNPPPCFFVHFLGAKKSF